MVLFRLQDSSYEAGSMLGSGDRRRYQNEIMTSWERYPPVNQPDQSAKTLMPYPSSIIGTLQANKGQIIKTCDTYVCELHGDANVLYQH